MGSHDDRTGEVREWDVGRCGLKTTLHRNRLCETEKVSDHAVNYVQADSDDERPAQERGQEAVSIRPFCPRSDGVTV